MTIRMTYVGKYYRKNGTLVKGHYRRVTKKAVAAWVNNLRKARLKDAWTSTCCIDFGKYKVLTNKGSVSCVGDFVTKPRLAVSLLEYSKRKEKMPSDVVDCGRDAILSDDFGPQRFCAETGEKLERRYVCALSMKSDEMVTPFRVWNDHMNCFELVYGVEEIEFWHHQDGTECENVDSGNHHKNMDEEDLLNVYRGLKGKDADWYLAHKDEMKTIYKDHADDAGKPEKECLPILYDEDGHPLSDIYDELADERMEIRTDGMTELTSQEMYIMGYASYVLAFNPYKVRDKLKATTNVREVIREQIADLVDIFIETGFKHPKLERRSRVYPKNWNEMEAQLAFDNSWSRVDYEKESREQLFVMQY